MSRPFGESQDFPITILHRTSWRLTKDANFLKGGIVLQIAVTTVSNTYAEEIKTPFYGERLDGLLCARSHDLRGIVNGIDYDVFNPETDACITQKYNAKELPQEKVKNKIQLQRDLGLNEDPNAMLIGIPFPV